MKPKARRARLVVIGLAVAVLSPSILAEPAQAVTLMTITGIVTDQIGTPIVGARVSDQRQDVLTDANGRYTLNEDRIQNSQLTVFKAGFDAAGPRTVTPVDALADVNFLLDYELDPVVLPIAFNSTPRTVEVSASSYAPTTSCVSWTDANTGSVVNLTLTTAVAGGESLWQGSFDVSVGTPEGGHAGAAVAKRCSDGLALTKLKSAGYVVDTTPPVIDLLQPSGWTNSSSPTLGARALDALASVASVAIRLDGGPDLAWTRGPRGGEVRAATSGLADGPHTFDVTAVDYAGNVSSVQQTFNVETASPTASDASPVGEIASASPLLSVRLLDDLSGIQPTSLAMTLRRDGVSNRLQSRWDTTTGELSYQVPAAITGVGLGESPLLDGRYEVVVTGADRAGNLVTVSWSFTVRHWLPSVPTPSREVVL